MHQLSENTQDVHVPAELREYKALDSLYCANIKHKHTHRSLHQHTAEGDRDGIVSRSKKARKQLIRHVWRDIRYQGFMPWHTEQDWTMLLWNERFQLPPPPAHSVEHRHTVIIGVSCVTVCLCSSLPLFVLRCSSGIRAYTTVNKDRQYWKRLSGTSPGAHKVNAGRMTEEQITGDGGVMSLSSGAY